MVHEEIIAVPQRVLVGALSLGREPSDVKPGLVIWTAHDQYLGDLGELRIQDLGNNRTKAYCIWEIPSIAEALAFEARIQACTQLVNKESLQAALDRGEDEREAAISLYETQKRVHQVFWGTADDPIDRYLSSVATLPHRERALLLFAGLTVDELASAARSYFIRPDPEDGPPIAQESLFPWLIPYTQDTEIVRLVNHQMEKARGDMCYRRLARLRRILDSAKSQLQRDGVLSEQKHPPKAKASDHYAHRDPERRRAIVEEYREAKSRGYVTNKDSWALAKHQITGRTLYNYEKEYDQEA
jgi:hypothetical protein